MRWYRPCAMRFSSPVAFVCHSATAAAELSHPPNGDPNNITWRTRTKVDACGHQHATSVSPFLLVSLVSSVPLSPFACVPLPLQSTAVYVRWRAIWGWMTNLHANNKKRQTTQNNSHKS